MSRITLDAYYTPDRLAVALVGLLPIGPGDVALEPHAGGGAFVRALNAKGAGVFAGDVNRDAAGLAQADFAVVGDFLDLDDAGPGVTWIVGNPPYSDAEAHIRHALDITGRHVAFLLRLAILETKIRIPLWEEHPPRKVWVLSQRPSFTGNGKTDSCAYGWFWWDREHQGPPELGWTRWWL